MTGHRPCRELTNGHPPERKARIAVRVTELKAEISRHTRDLREVLKEALAPHSHSIKFAFVYGSVARGTDTESSDVDLLVVGDGLDYSGLHSAVQGAERKLGRPVNPLFLTIEEWDRKAAQKGPFVARVSALPRIFVIGSGEPNSGGFSP